MDSKGTFDSLQQARLVQVGFDIDLTLGAVGSAFTTQGAIGGKFQDLAKKNESH